MIRFAKDFLQQAGIQLTWNANTEDGEKNIPAFQRRVLYLAFKELVHNIVKHANATEVKLDFISSGDHYHLSVYDNGIGIRQSQLQAGQEWKSGGYGLENIRHNITKLFGNVSWENATESGGTKVSIDIDIISAVNDKNTYSRRPQNPPGVS
jgi:signal transduction histidine kinase